MNDFRRTLLAPNEVIMEGATLYDVNTYNGEAVEYLYVPAIAPYPNSSLVKLLFIDENGGEATSGNLTRIFYYNYSSANGISWGGVSQLNSYRGIEVRIRYDSVEVHLGEGGYGNYIAVTPYGGVNNTTATPKLLRKDPSELSYIRLYVGDEMFKMTYKPSTITYTWNYLKISYVSGNYPIYYKPYSA